MEVASRKPITASPIVIAGDAGRQKSQAVDVLLTTNRAILHNIGRVLGNQPSETTQ